MTHLLYFLGYWLVQTLFGLLNGFRVLLAVETKISPPPVSTITARVAASST